MVSTMDAQGFGNCTVTGSCEAVCPKNIPAHFIAEMNVDYFRAALLSREFDDVNKGAEEEG